MLRICDHPDCATLTLGTLCATHEQAPSPTMRFPRGRPFPTRARRTTRDGFALESPERAPAPAVSFGGGTAL
jgi:hypothetical protein